MDKAKCKEAIININAINTVCGLKGFYDKDFEEALKIAVECIEKQIPRKPKMPHMYIREWECQRCKSYFARLDDRPRYCCECGQRIDWSEVD